MTAWSMVATYSLADLVFDKLTYQLTNWLADGDELPQLLAR